MKPKEKKKEKTWKKGKTWRKAKEIESVYTPIYLVKIRGDSGRRLYFRTATASNWEKGGSKVLEDSRWASSDGGSPITGTEDTSGDSESTPILPVKGSTPPSGAKLSNVSASSVSGRDTKLEDSELFSVGR